MKESNQLRTLFTNTIMLYILRVSGYVFPLITFPYLTRTLGPDKYGVIVMVNAIIIYFQIFVDFGFLLYATKECAINRNDNKRLGKLIGVVIQAKSVLAITGFVMLLILIMFTNLFNDNYIFLIMSYIPVVTSIFITDYLFRGLEVMKIITYRTIIVKSIYVVLILCLVKKPTDYFLIPLIDTVTNIIVIIWTWHYIIKKLKIPIIYGNIKEVYYCIKGASVFFLSRIASTIYGATNTILIGKSYANIAVGQYGAANNLTSSIRNLFSPIADSIYPYMIQNKNYKLVKWILIISTPIIFIGTVGIYIFAEPILRIILGDEFIDATPLFRAMLPLIVITLPTYLLGYPILGAMGKMKQANLSVIYGAIFHALGLIAMISLGKIDMFSIIYLTCCTETLILLMRGYHVFQGMRCKYKV